MDKKLEREGSFLPSQDRKKLFFGKGSSRETIRGLINETSNIIGKEKASFFMIFSKKDNEMEFLQNYYGQTFQRWRYALLIGVVFFDLFIFVDYLARDTFRSTAFFILTEACRYLTVIITAFILVFVNFKFVQKRLYLGEFLLALAVLTFHVFVMVCGMFALAKTDFGACNKGVLMVVFVTFIAARLRFVYTFIIGVLSSALWIILLISFYYRQYKFVVISPIVFHLTAVVFAVLEIRGIESTFRSLYRKEKKREVFKNLILEEKERKVELLRNIFPEVFLKEVISRHMKERLFYIHDELTLVQSDFIDFTEKSKLPLFGSQKLIRTLNRIYSEFDLVTQQHGLELIKTIGDAYFVADLNNSGQVKCIEFALGLVEKLVQMNKVNAWDFEMRIGMSSGQCSVGYVGKLFQLDVFGGPRGRVKLMESFSKANKILVSIELLEENENVFNFSQGVEVSDSYFVEGRKEKQQHSSVSPSSKKAVEEALATTFLPSFELISSSKTKNDSTSMTTSVVSIMDSNVFQSLFRLQKFPLRYKGSLGVKENKKFTAAYLRKTDFLRISTSVMISTIMTLYSISVTFYGGFSSIFTDNDTSLIRVMFLNSPLIFLCSATVVSAVLSVFFCIPVKSKIMVTVLYILMGAQIVTLTIFMYLAFGFLFVSRKSGLIPVIETMRIEASVPIYAVLSFMSFPIPYEVKIVYSSVHSLCVIVIYFVVFLAVYPELTSFEPDNPVLLFITLLVEILTQYSLHHSHRMEYLKLRELEMAIKEVKKTIAGNDKVLSSSFPSFLFEKKRPSDFDEYKDGAILFCEFRIDRRREQSHVETMSFANDIFYAFDKIVNSCQCYKIKSIEHTYVVMHPESFRKIVKCSFRLLGEFKRNVKKRMMSRSRSRSTDVDDELMVFKMPNVELRTGVMNGPFCAGVIGVQRIAYDVFGSQVNLCHRMMTLCEDGHVQTAVDEETVRKLAGDVCMVEERRKVNVKGIGEIESLYLSERIF